MLALTLQEPLISESQLFPLIGVDLMLSEDEEVYLLEINSIPAGLGVARIVSEVLMTRNALPRSAIDLGFSGVSFFSEYVSRMASVIKGKKVVIVEPKSEKLPVLRADKLKIAEHLAGYGFDPVFVKRQDLSYRGKSYVVCTGGGCFKPSIIIRRVTGLRSLSNPYQRVINPPFAGKLSQNKYEVYRLAEHIFRGSNTGLRIPRTLLVESKEDLFWAFDEIKSISKEVVFKPLNGCGGVGILFVNDRSELSRLKLDFPILVQEKINGFKILGNGGSEYVFDIRGFIINSRLAALHLRRGPCPSKKGGECLITNITMGGSYIHAFFDPNASWVSQHDLEVNIGTIYEELSFVDRKAIVFGSDLMKRLENISRRLSLGIYSYLKRFSLTS